MNRDVIDHTLFVTDLDGTLLDDCSRVSPRSASILSELSRRGAKITVATARTPATVEPLLRNVHSTIPAIVMTGASFWDRVEHRYTSTSFMPRDVATEALALCRRRNVNPFIYTLDSTSMLQVYHSGAMSRGEQKFVDERRGLPLKRFHLDEPACAAPYIEGTVIMFAMGPKDDIFAVADELRARVDCSVSAYVDIFGKDTGILELFTRGVSKAAAIKSLARQIGVDNVVVFGDNLNDIPMMEIATQSYAVANALDEVKQAATSVIGPNTADSVPLAIASICGFDDFD